MGYYAGDFYAGARGDPGFLGTLFGLAKSAVGMVPGIGPIASRGMEAIAARAGGAATAGRSVIAPVKGVIMKHPAATAAGVAGVAGLGAGALVQHAMAGGACPKGFHMCKSKHGCKRGGCVRNRHMRVTNPRALRRALRRTQGFAKLAMRTIHLVHPKKRARFGGFRKTRRRK